MTDIPAFLDSTANPVPAENRSGKLALFTQDILTAAARFRTGRQKPTDAHTFRAQVKKMLLAASEACRGSDYASADLKYALYAVVAYVDETVLNSGHPAFAAWNQSPLESEIFKSAQVAGAAFFQYLNQLLERDDSQDLADILEVYHLCLLLGFRGRYATSEQGSLDAMSIQVRERVDRIRGPRPELTPDWKPTVAPDLAPTNDPWFRRLGYAAIVATVGGLALFGLFWLVLREATPTAPAPGDAGATVITERTLP